jgi:hypothetical protein
MHLYVDAQSPSPIRRPLTQLDHVIEGGGVPPNQTRPSILEPTGFLGINPGTVARVIEDLKQSGYRPLRPVGDASLSSISGCSLPRDAPAETMTGKPFGGAINPVEEEDEPCIS